MPSVRKCKKRLWELIRYNERTYHLTGIDSDTQPYMGSSIERVMTAWCIARDVMCSRRVMRAGRRVYWINKRRRHEPCVTYHTLDKKKRATLA